MDKREGVIWGYRLILNREPESQETVDAGAEQFSTPLELRRSLRKSGEFASILERAGQPFTSSVDIDWRAGTLWAYRLLLNREPTAEEMAASLSCENTINDLRLRVLLKAEREVKWPGLRPLADFSIINAFAPFAVRLPIPGVFQDVLGSITRVEYLGHAWAGLDGYVYRGVPRDTEQGLHGTAEWVGTFRSVLEAGDKFEAIELGAGWGPWLIVSNKAAERRGIRRVSLAGVEGSEDHYGFMLDNFRINGLAVEDHSLHLAVAGAYDGMASFPKLNFAHDDYGANAVFSDADQAPSEDRGALEEVRSISLASLLKHKDRVDLIHIDIQGHEEAVIRAGLDQLNAKVRRMVIGTHSRAIEGHLLDLLQDNGWVCEFEVPCKMVLREGGKLDLVVDGEQVWRNERLPVLNRQLA